MSDFDRAFEIVVGLEGGYVNDPKDVGGETKYGISARAYPGEHICALTLDRAKSIYLTDYWMKAGCTQLAWPLSMLVFDSAVNQGVGVATRLLQKSAGVDQDGVIGAATMRAVNAAKPLDMCALFLADRALRYFGTKGFESFGRGWLKRTYHLALNGI